MSDRGTGAFGQVDVSISDLARAYAQRLIGQSQNVKGYGGKLPGSTIFFGLPGEPGFWAAAKLAIMTPSPR